MIIYKDLLTGDELFSDSYKFQEIDGAVYEVDCAMVKEEFGQFEPRQDNEDKSLLVPDKTDPTPAGEGVELDPNDEDNTVMVINVVRDFRLQEMAGAYPKLKDYSVAFKTYLKKLSMAMKERGATPDEIKAVENSIASYYQKVIMPNFKDYEFFTGATMADEAMVVLMNTREDGVTPYATFWKAGLEATKM